MNISVGIVTYKRPETLKLVLDNLRTQSKKPYEIIIVDSSDDDKTEKLVKKYRVKYIHTEKRIYQPQARNIILKKCRGDVIAFLDDDSIPDRSWLENIEKGYSYENVVGVSGPALNTDEKMVVKEKIIRSEKNRNYFTSSGDLLMEAKRWIPPEPVFCSLMLGANMSFLVKPLKEVGFDEFYSHDAAVREETDPQIALIKKGCRFVYMPEALTYHIKAASGGIRANPEKDYYYWAGIHHRYMADKYFPKWKTRLSWIFWSRNPPCIWACLLLAVCRRDMNILKWVWGLWRG
jgi:glycosyltransferase involved in cell wall biosynthesis